MMKRKKKIGIKGRMFKIRVYTIFEFKFVKCVRTTAGMSNNLRCCLMKDTRADDDENPEDAVRVLETMDGLVRLWLKCVDMDHIPTFSILSY